jgi:hypothetical protein
MLSRRCARFEPARAQPAALAQHWLLFNQREIAMPRFLRLFCSMLALLAWAAYAQGAPAYQALKFDGQFWPRLLNDLGQVAGIG